MIRRRAILWVVVLLALGGQTSVLVAWVIAWRRGGSYIERSRDWWFVSGKKTFHGIEQFAPGRRQRSIREFVHWDPELPIEERGLKEREVVQTQTELGNIELWPSWGRAHPNPAAFEYFEGSAFGWPVVCLFYELRDDAGLPTVRGGIQLEPLLLGSSPLGGPVARVIPLRPAWIGLAVNTLLFASVWTILPLAHYVFVTRHRKSRGGCSNCGYELRGLPPHAPCPECGTPS